MLPHLVLALRAAVAAKSPIQEIYIGSYDGPNGCVYEEDSMGAGTGWRLRVKVKGPAIYVSPVMMEALINVIPKLHCTPEMGQYITFVILVKNLIRQS
jgi:hypothetical protein